MNAQRATAALEQDIEVAACLGILHHSETRAMARNGQIVAIVGRDLKKDAAVRPALVSLAGRMQKSRAEFEASCGVVAIAQREPQLLQSRCILFIARKIGKQGKIVAARNPAKMRGEPAGKRLAGAGFTQLRGIRLIGIDRDGIFRADRRFLRQFTGRFEGTRQLARFDLARFYIGLIERIDAK